ncbi:MAG: helix-turn-helix domain-containing protein [Vicinamibacterales bacterium]
MRRSRCPVSCTLDLLGDRWSLLVVRDVVRGKRRFAEFLESSEGIPTNILAERLKRLAAKGIIRARRYSQHPPRVEYRLTAKGEDLRPVIRAMVEWGIRHAGGRTPPGYEPTITAKAPRRQNTSTVKPAASSRSTSASSVK